jgi:hypothetical protein
MASPIRKAQISLSRSRPKQEQIHFKNYPFYSTFSSHCNTFFAEPQAVIRQDLNSKNTIPEKLRD